MIYLLDTNVCIKLLNNSNQLVVKRLAQEEPKHINLCSIVELELYYGAHHSKKLLENIKKLDRFCSQFKVIYFDSNCAKIAGLIRSQLNKKGTPIGVYDLQIASVALAYDLILDRAVREIIYEVAWEVGFQYDRVISTFVVTDEQIKTGAVGANPLLSKVMTEGVLV
jgi:tRNA(fMet)-specific endonuclease VapC